MSIRQLGLSKFLGKLELAVMEVVWKHNPATVQDVLALLNRGKRKFAYTTVMTIMQRLSSKGWLATDKKGRAYVYRPTLSPKEAEAHAVGKIVRGLLSDHGDVAIAQFMKEVGEITPEQLSKLNSLAQRRKNE